MATDWAADVKKYAANADDAAIAGIVRYCGIALRNRDSSLVSFSDKTEIDRVRTNFLQKKLGLTQADSVLDAAIAKVGAAMKADRTKNRVTVYYLLAAEFKQLGMFISKTAAKAPAKSAVAAAPKAAAKPAPKAAAKVAAAKPAPKVAAKVAAAKPVAAKPAAKTAAKTVGAAALVAGSAAAAKKPAVKKAAVKVAAKPVAKQAAVTTKKSAPTKAAVSTAPAKVSAPVSTGTVAAATALGGAAPAAAASGVEAVKDTAAKAVGTVSAPVNIAAAAPSPAMSAPAAKTAAPSDDDAGLGWLYWVLGGLLLLALLWFLFHRGPAPQTGVASTPTEAAMAAAPMSDAGTDLAAAPAEGAAMIPIGAGVTTETRDGKPVVKVYFDTGKIDVVAAFAGSADGLKSYLDSHSGSVLNVSGYSDPSGNAAANADLSKKRAQAVQAALVTAGIPEGSAMLVKPDNAADASVPKEAARRVEVMVK